MDKELVDDIERARRDMVNARIELKEMEELYFNEKNKNKKLRLELDTIENSLIWKIVSPLITSQFTILKITDTLRKIKRLIKKIIIKIIK